MFQKLRKRWGRGTQLFVQNKMSLGTSIDKNLATGGHTSNGKVYSKVSDMWSSELLGLGSNEEEARKEWYEKGAQYWEDDKIPPTIEGVLGGFGFVSKDDITESTKFIQAIAKRRPTIRFERAVDCGAGIGRVAAGLLIPLFTKVDIVEQSPKLIAEAKKALSSKVNTYHCLGLQNW